MISRYTRPQMGEVWSEERRFQYWLKIETLHLEALSQKGMVEKRVVEEVRKRARVNIPRLRELEKKTRHEVVAFVESIIEQVPEAGKFLHFGLTSSDVMDTALACQLKEAGEIIFKDLEELLQSLKEKALTYKDTVMMGRTHGMHAEPITFGWKMALWWEEMRRNRERFKEAWDGVKFGKISGAVGTFSHLDPEIEEYICSRLGLSPDPISSQVIQRDRHAHFLLSLALIASSLEKFALEVRHLQRSEVGEVEEPFTKGQKGSSAMPHKRNPILCERICGLARVIRSNALASLENIPLWHERDISHSSVERIIIPDSCILTDYILERFTWIIRNLKVNTARMLKNLESSGDIFFSQKLMLKIMEKGVDRKKAYEEIQKIALESIERKKNFKDAIQKSPFIREILTQQELEDCFNVKEYLKNIDKIFKRLGLSPPEGR